MSLLIAAGLFMKSLLNVSRVDLGVHVDSIVTFALSPERSGYDSTGALQLYARVEDALAAVPGVNGVSSALVPLLAGDNWGTDVNVQGFAAGPDVDNNSRFNEIGPAYFATLGVSPVAGREFTAADHLGAPQVAVVNQAFAKKFNLGNGAVGRVHVHERPRFDEHPDRGRHPGHQVQRRQAGRARGVLSPMAAGHARVGNEFLRPLATRPGPASGDPRSAEAHRPRSARGRAQTMPQQVRENVFLDRMISILSASFAALATLLAAIGLYGVLAYTVAQRTREIGVRMALGADARQVRAMVLRQVTGMMVVGGVIGLAGAYGLGRAASSLLYGLKGHDPVVFVLAVLALVIVALGAGYMPARRASLVDPVKALRYE